jgi:hypothetical protein
LQRLIWMFLGNWKPTTPTQTKQDIHFSSVPAMADQLWSRSSQLPHTQGRGVKFTPQRPKLPAGLVKW